MNESKRVAVCVIYLLLGALLLGLGMAEQVDEFWSGMGAALLAVGVLRLIRLYRWNKDEAYREKIRIETTDERNRYIRSKAWAWAGYLFIMIAAVLVIVMKVLGQEQLSMAASIGMCLMLILYWGSYGILNKKY